jgi:dissimilatory sulfite reductase (desulfoviridin) alpha/beta subunit
MRINNSGHQGFSFKVNQPGQFILQIQDLLVISGVLYRYGILHLVLRFGFEL